MKISYQRTGGFAGMVMSHEFDSHTLSPKEMDELEQLVDTADFFDLPPKISAETPVTDQFHYTLTVETDEQQHSIEVGDAAAPEKLKPLLNKLRELSRAARSE